MESERCTVSGKPPTMPNTSGVPVDEKRPDGQYKDHWVLCAEERAKGYIRPVRMSYVHVGPPGPTFALRDLTDEERQSYGDEYVKYEPYPPGHHGSALGHLWSQAALDKVGKGCGVETRMPRACAETYARQPGYYGSTFCCGCGDYFKVGRDGEFVWADSSSERVGT